MHVLRVEFETLRTIVLYSGEKKNFCRGLDVQVLCALQSLEPDFHSTKWIGYLSSTGVPHPVSHALGSRLLKAAYTVI